MAKLIKSQSVSISFTDPDDATKPITRRAGNIDPAASEENLFLFADALASLRTGSDTLELALSTTATVPR